jgi:hypothetical protein
LAERLIILAAAVNCLFEDRRIAGNATQAILLDQKTSQRLYSSAKLDQEGSIG